MSYKVSDGITQSLLKLSLQCRRRLSYVLSGWEPVEATSKNLEFGNLIHYLIEHTDQESPHQLSANWAVEKIKEQRVDPSILEYVLAAAIPVYEAYLKFWQVQDAKIEWLELEKKMDVKYDGRWRLRGKLDAIFRWKQSRSQSLWILETKCQSQVNDAQIEQTLTFDLQTLFYRTMLICSGSRVRGVLYNIVRIPTLKLKDGESLKDFSERIKSHIEKDPEHYFKRFEMRFDPKQIAIFEQALPIQLSEFEDIVEGRRFSFGNQTACVGRGACPFLEACATDTMTGYVKRKGRFFSELSERRPT